MSAGRDITSPAELPARMRAKITFESSAVGLSADMSAPSTPRCVAADSPAVPTPHPGTAGQPACHHVMCAQVYGGARCLDPVGVCIDFRDGHQTHPE